MKIKREKLFVMWDVFQRLLVKKSAVKFHYMILKNKQAIEPEIESIREIGKPSQDYQEFDSKRIQMCNEFCEKDESGKPAVVNNNFVIPDDKKKAFEDALTALKEEYKEALDSVDSKRQEIDELMEEDVDLPLVKIPLSVIPNDLLGQEVEALFDIIDDEA